MATIFVQLSLIWVPMEVGLDFSPLRDAASALLAGHSVYTDPLFVYPPTAALPMLPFTGRLGRRRLPDLGDRRRSRRSCCGRGAAGRGSARAATGSRSVAMISILMLGSAVATDSLLLGNMSPVLVPFAVYTLLSFERGNWTRGCVVLVISLLIKPLLAPLLLLPIVRRQWSALALSLGPARGRARGSRGADPRAPAGCRRWPGSCSAAPTCTARTRSTTCRWPGWGEFNHHHRCARSRPRSSSPRSAWPASCAGPGAASDGAGAAADRAPRCC